jgi:hypothetical protein
MRSNEHWYDLTVEEVIPFGFRWEILEGGDDFIGEVSTPESLITPKSLVMTATCGKFLDAVTSVLYF